MTSPVQIWTHAVHHTAFRCGGWAFVRLSGGEASGVAGGERNTTPRRMALTGLGAALAGAPPGAVTIYTASEDLLALADALAGRPNEQAQLDLDVELLAPLAAAARSHQLTFVRTPMRPDTPLAFAAAWADQVMDRAKATGAFKAAIPKSNLAKLAFPVMR